MCGRYALHSHPDVVALQFDLAAMPVFAPRYNISPTASVLMVKAKGPALARWGLKGKIHNARAESVREKPAFRDAYRHRRCLIPANGFYEWRHKQPYYVRPAADELFAFAGLWDLETCAVVTTEANDTMRRIHDRMPVLIPRESYAAWLGGADDLLHPALDEMIVAYPVSSAVNRAANDSPELIKPSEDFQGRSGELFGD